MIKAAIYQARNMFQVSEIDIDYFLEADKRAYPRFLYCMRETDSPYFTEPNPLHLDQYAVYLYYLSRELYLIGYPTLADYIYILNRSINSMDLYYEVQMPKVWRCSHPVGSVIGRAKIGEKFSFMQGCTVGNNKGIYPVIGNNVTMKGNSTIIGNCNIGNNVVIAFGVIIKDRNVPNDCIVFQGNNLELIIWSKDRSLRN